MRIPLIKKLGEFINDHDADYVEESIKVLEDLAESPNMKEEELDVVGELLSNMYGALEVQKMIDEGTPAKEARNAFMKRVTGSVS